METFAVTDVPALLGKAASHGAAEPLLTYCDDATGERVELSAAQLGSWAARTAALLRQGCGLAVGSRAAVLLPAHWQSAAVVLGAWSVGVSLALRSAALAGLASYGSDGAEPFDAVFVSAKRADDWLEDVPQARHRFVLGLTPGATELPQVPTGYRDYLAEVRRYPDTTPAYATIRDTDAATSDGSTFGEWERLTRGLVETLDLRAGERILVTDVEYEHPLKWLLAPLWVGASVVLCANLDPGAAAARAAAEGATRIL